MVVAVAVAAVVAVTAVCFVDYDADDLMSRGSSCFLAR